MSLNDCFPVFMVNMRQMADKFAPVLGHFWLSDGVGMWIQRSQKGHNRSVDQVWKRSGGSGPKVWQPFKNSGPDVDQTCYVFFAEIFKVTF